VPELRRAGPFSTGKPASNAMPAWTSVPWIASPSPAMATRRDLRTRLKAPATHTAQDLYVSAELKTGRVMVKDEDVCLHCGLCAERCPTGAWDMQKFLLNTTQARSWLSGRTQSTSGGRMNRIEAINDFVIKFANVNGSGFGFGQRTLFQGRDAHGRAGEPPQHLPEQHPGYADLVRGAGVRKRLSRTARRGRHDGRHEPADLGCRHR
jgi:NAD-dependent dihydropyrimidine dehydrogenase PreA subunit